jgi:hypothetical protein
MWESEVVSYRSKEKGFVKHTTTIFADVGRCPSLAMRMAEVRRVLMRGFAANFAGNACRQVGQVFLP